MTRMSQKQFKDLLKKKGVEWPWELPAADQKKLEQKGKSKLNNVKVELDGYIFDSKKEAKYYEELKIRKRAGQILDFEVKPEKFILQPGFRDKAGKWIRPITYTADFKEILSSGEIEYIDVKGFRTDKFNIKYKMFLYNFPDLVLKLL